MARGLGVPLVVLKRAIFFELLGFISCFAQSLDADFLLNYLRALYSHLIWSGNSI